MREKFAIVLLCVALAGCETVHSAFHATPSKFIVFFEAKSAEMTPDAAAIAKDAASAVRNTHPAMVQIAAGVAPGDNMEISTPRFAAVRQALVDDGVSEDIIARSAIPDPKLDTGPARQRVEIRLLSKAP